MKRKICKIIYKTGTALFAAACLFSFLLPLPKKIAYGESYDCVWSDGTISKESYSSAYQSLTGITEEGVLLERDGLTGVIASKAAAVYSTLQEGTLNELLQCEAEGTRIDRAALYRTFSKRVWYSGEYYVWTGNNVERASRAAGSELIVLSGTVSPRILRETGATSVHLRAEATIRADSLVGSDVTLIYTQEPYTSSGGAVYIEPAGGKRLVAALANSEELTVDDDTMFADQGALIACQNLSALTLPFAGSQKSWSGSEYVSELAYLFANGKDYFVPQTLTSVTVTGGRISATAFYACSRLKTIDLCKVDPHEISAEAFLGLDALEYLHTPKRDVLLSGDFTASTLECGCTGYTKNHSQK